MILQFGHSVLITGQDNLAERNCTLGNYPQRQVSFVNRGNRTEFSKECVLKDR